MRFSAGRISLFREMDLIRWFAFPKHVCNFLDFKPVLLAYFVLYLYQNFHILSLSFIRIGSIWRIQSNALRVIKTSFRRNYFQEKLQTIKKKMVISQDFKLFSVLCVRDTNKSRSLWFILSKHIMRKHCSCSYIWMDLLFRKQKFVWPVGRLCSLYYLCNVGGKQAKWKLTKIDSYKLLAAQAAEWRIKICIIKTQTKSNI